VKDDWAAHPMALLRAHHKNSSRTLADRDSRSVSYRHGIPSISDAQLQGKTAAVVSKSHLPNISRRRRPQCGEDVRSAITAFHGWIPRVARDPSPLSRLPCIESHCGERQLRKPSTTSGFGKVLLTGLLCKRTLSHHQVL